MRITKSTGEQFLLSDYNVVAQDFIVSSIPLNATYASIEGRSGLVDLGADYGQRTIVVPFYIESEDLLDFPLLRDQLFDIIASTGPIYIEELRRQHYGEGESQLVGGKRYLVRLNNEVALDQQFKYGFGELEFITSDLPFAESVATTQEIHANGINSDRELWSIGMGLYSDDSTFVYTHEGAMFSVFNAGNIEVHPFQQEISITIRNVVGSANHFELRNTTTAETFRVNEQVTSSQVIKLDGPNITSNGLQFLRKTNKTFISLQPGWNNFAIVGASTATVEFDFRFYYR